MSCVAELPRLAALKSRHAEGLEIVSIAFDEDPDAVRSLAAEKALSWAQVCDGKGAEGELMKTFNAQGFPTYFVIGRDGELLAKKVPIAEVETVIERALAP